MARDKKTMIGFDPLAWLDKDSSEGSNKTKKDTNKVTVKNTGKTSSKETEKDSSRSSAKAKGKLKNINVLGHEIDENALTKGYALASEALDEIAGDFYSELFEQHPEIEPLFKDVSTQAQAAKLSATINLLVENLHNERVLLTTLEEIGRRHQGYGAKAEHYPVVVELLLGCFKKKIGRSWTKAINTAWTSLLGAVAETMYSVYSEEEEPVSDSVVKAEETLEFAEDVQNVDEFSDDIMSDKPVLQLKGVQDISKSQSLKNDLVLLINDNDEIEIDGSLVERIDGSALQLICALFIYSKQNNLIIRWLNPSDALISSAEVIGVNKIIELS